MNTETLKKELPGVDQIIDAIDEIRAIPEEDITEETLPLIMQAFESVLDDKLSSTSVNEILISLKKSSIPFEEAKNQNLRIKNLLKDYLQSLNLTKNKELIVKYIIDYIGKTFDDAIDRYTNNDIHINFLKTKEKAQLPVYAHLTDAGADIYAAEDQIIPANSFSNKVDTGLRMEMKSGWELQIRMRSGMAAKTKLRLSNGIATIDSDYRGPIMLLFDNFDDQPYVIHAGDRIAQFILAPSYHFSSNLVKEINETDRGQGGFGSTGK